MAYTTIDNPELYFQTKLYTGNGGTNALTLDGSENMQPDLVWIKNRNGTQDHHLFDSVRGTLKRLESNSNTNEETRASSLTSYDSDGFTLGTYANTNTSSDTYVAWNWKKVAGVFDIQTWTGNGSNRTISHNLGAVPQMMIVKKRSPAGGNWQVNTAQLAANQLVELDENAAVVQDNTYFNNTRPTSSVFSLGTDGNQNTNGHTYLGYLFGNKQGVSKVGSYTGNGNADGTFVYTGFKPAFIIVKKTNASEDWELFDNKRLGYNVDNNNVVPNTNSAEATSDRLDIVSNGFKFRTAAGSVNASGDSFIYMCFAENPFVTSTGVPACAR